MGEGQGGGQLAKQFTQQECTSALSHSPSSPRSHSPRSPQEGRDPLRLRVEVRRRRVRPDRRRHDLDEAPRQGGFVIPESVQDVRDWSQRARMLRGPTRRWRRWRRSSARTRPAISASGARSSAWPGNETDVYDLWIHVVDFSTEPAADHLPEKGPDEDRQRHPPRLRQGSARPALRPGRAGRHGPGPEAARAVEKAPNLVKGDFEQGRRRTPRLGPLPHDVTWVAEKAEGAATEEPRHPLHHERRRRRNDGRALLQRLLPRRGGRDLSLPVPLEDHGLGGQGVHQVLRRVLHRVPARPTRRRGPTERREVYRSQQNLAGSPGVWNVQTEDFTPQHTQYTPRWGRVMLYAYWPAGTVEWDDVVVKQVAPRRPARARRSGGRRRRRRCGATRSKEKAPVGRPILALVSKREDEAEAKNLFVAAACETAPSRDRSLVLDPRVCDNPVESWRFPPLDVAVFGGLPGQAPWARLARDSSSG